MPIAGNEAARVRCVAFRARSRELPRAPWPLPPRSQRSSRHAGLKDYAFCMSRCPHIFILRYLAAPKTRIPFPLPSKSRQPSPVALLTPHRERWRGGQWLTRRAPGALLAQLPCTRRPLPPRMPLRCCRYPAGVCHPAPRAHPPDGGRSCGKRPPHRACD